MNARRRILSTVAVAGLLAGCTGLVDKSGAPELTTFVVGYANSGPNANGGSPAGRVFVSDLEAKFGDRLDLVEKRNVGEPAIVRALINGELDAAWIPTRSLSDGGIPGFDALSAPMVLTNYEAEAAVIEPGTAQPFLDQLADTGLTGLTLASGGLRRPVSSTDPLLEAADWSGRSVTATADSQRTAFETLGAVPIPVGAASQVGFDGVATGAELDLGSYNEAGLSLIAPYVTANVVLWPKVWLLAVNAERFEALSPGDQQLIREAATAANQASTQPRNEAGLALSLCDAGTRFATASPEQQAELEQAFAPAVERLAADPIDGPLLTVVQGVAAAHPDVEAVTVPQRCTGDAPPSTAVEDIPTSLSDIPPGTYRMTVTEQDLIDAGIDAGRVAGNDVVVTLVLKPDGTYRQFGDSIDDGVDDFANLLFEAGTYRGEGSTVYFVPDVNEQRRLKAHGVNAAIDGPGFQLQTDPYAATWSGEQGMLAFSNLAGIEDPIGLLWMVANAYQRID